MVLLCFGDSNTWGFDPRLPLGGRYETPWPKLLADLTGHAVLNCGENGRTIPHSFAHVALLHRLVNETRPDKLLIMLGTNDILSLFPGDPAAVGNRMERLLTHLRETFSSLSILLLAPPPVEIPVDSDGLAEVYAGIARRLEIDFVDTNQWNIPLAYDGVHFTEEGHTIFARQLRELL